MSSISVTIHSPGNITEGDVRELLARAEGATVAHEPPVLEALARAYRLKAEILLARRAGVVVGALPILRIRGPLGAVDACVAYLDGGGPIGPPEARDALVSFATERALARGATLELRSRSPVTLASGRARVMVSREKDLLVRELPGDPDAIAREIPFKTRNHLRKALRAGLWSESRPADDESLQAFRGVYARTMRHLGSPPHGMEVFRRLARALGPRARVSLVRGPGDVVLAAALVLDDRQGHAVLPWAASD
ncbi:MAG TPA: GNAT family N-acetyltransferase, partial [Planctomycetota bacterium]|nr:GNAT family N-acetyltransferase [Planctomycetota bacterium]